MGKVVPGPGHPDFVHPVTEAPFRGDRPTVKTIKDLKKRLSELEHLYPRNLTKDRVAMYKQAIDKIEKLIDAKDPPQDPLVA